MILLFWKTINKTPNGSLKRPAQQRLRGVNPNNELLEIGWLKNGGKRSRKDTILLIISAKIHSIFVGTKCNLVSLCEVLYAKAYFFLKKVDAIYYTQIFEDMLSEVARLTLGNVCIRQQDNLPKADHCIILSMSWQKLFSIIESVRSSNVFKICTVPFQIVIRLMRGNMTKKKTKWFQVFVDSEKLLHKLRLQYKNFVSKYYCIQYKELVAFLDLLHLCFLAKKSFP